MKSLVTLFTLICIYFPDCMAQVSEYPIAGQWPYGQPFAIEKHSSGSNDLIFYSEGTVLHIADLNPLGEVQALSSFRTNYLVKNIAISPNGQTVVVNDESRWISVLDISNPQSPILLGRFDFDDESLPAHLQGGKPKGMDFINDTTLVSAISPKGIWALDISDPQNIAVIGDIFEPGTDTVSDVAIYDQYAFVADDLDGLSVYDVSDLSNISLVLRDATYSKAHNIQIIDDTAYIARKSEGVSLASIDLLPNLSVTEIITFSDDVGDARKVYPLPGSYLAIASGSEGVLIFDINNMAAPVLIQSSGTTSPGIIVKDFLIVGLDRGTPNGQFKNGLVVYDTDAMGTVGALQELSFSQLQEPTVDVEVFQDKITLLMDDGGVVLVDNSNPYRPETSLWLHQDRRITAAVSIENYLIAGEPREELLITDISDINNPVTIPGYDIGNRFPNHMIVLDNNHILVAYRDEIEWLNISQQGATVRGHWSGSLLLRVARDNEIIVAIGGTQITILDSSLVGNPVLLAQHTTSDVIKDVALVDDYLYLALGLGGLQIWDISDPVNANVVSTTETSPMPIEGVDIHNQVAYLASGALFGLLEYDISDLADPQLLNFYKTQSDGVKVVANDDFLVVADEAAGAIIFSKSAPTEIPIFKNGFE
jgi:hypothetical protein